MVHASFSLCQLSGKHIVRGNEETAAMADVVWQRINDELDRRKSKFKTPGSWAALGRSICATDQRMHNWRVRGIPPRLHAAIALALGWSIDQLLGLDSPLEASPVEPLSSSVAHDVSLPSRRVEPRKISWGDVVDGIALHDELYLLAMPDDAMAPEYPKGTELQWSKSKPFQPGSVVVVRDRAGQVHARQCRQGKTVGHWIAAPMNPVYEALDSVGDGLTVLLVAAYRPMP